MYKVILITRFLLRQRISFFAIAATGLCVFLAFVVITVLSGLTADFKNYIHLCYGDCVISSRSLVGFGHYEQFMEMLGEEGTVEAVSPVIKNYGSVAVLDESAKRRVGRGRSAIVVGIDAAAHSRVTGFGQWVSLHKEDVENAFKPSYDPNLPACVPGIAFLFDGDEKGNYNNVAGELPRVKFEVSVFPLTAKGAPARSGLGEVSSKSFYCSDYTQTNHRADWDVICLPFQEAQTLFGMSAEPRRVNAIYVKFKPGVRVGAGCRRAAGLWEKFVKANVHVPGADLLKNVRVQSWKTHNRAIVAIAETQQVFVIVIFGLVGIITVFIVFAVFYMIVSHKSKDIGILKSVGISNGHVLLLFLGFGLAVGAVGSVLGALGGWQFLENIDHVENWFSRNFDFRLWYGEGSEITDVPNEIDVRVLAVIIASAILACLVGALAPSLQAARLKPVESLQVTQL
ncbi:MAG: ABC transporter permease [Planctomycetota bacterium]|jgi:ABC-type lipoprotein release transport system permease subunit